MVRKLDREAPRLDDFLLASGRVARQRGDLASARRDLTEAAARYRAHDGPAHPRTVEAERELAALDGRDRSSQKTSRLGPSPD